MNELDRLYRRWCQQEGLVIRDVNEQLHYVGAEYQYHWLEKFIDLSERKKSVDEEVSVFVEMFQ